MTDRRDVRRTFERIAEPFAERRRQPWPEVRTFLEGRAGDAALDLGCANGRHAELLAARADRVVALDAARSLLELAADRAGSAGWSASLLQGDVATLPLGDDAVDLATYVATVHHLPTRELRVGSFDELARVLSPEGRAVVSAWSTAHDRFDRSSGFDATVDWTLPDGSTVDRFYHVYDPAEFDRDLAASDLSVLDSRVSSGNCYATVGP